MSVHQTYKEALLSALQCLDDAEGHAGAAILNIALAGAHKELGRLYEVGEELIVNPEMFQDTGDVNINLILKLIENIRSTVESLKNINSLE